ncbi:MAG: tryptophan--tRNA ligase [Candidatus Lernaella stagnicola]|nr:tryptophan--tRNA ligase [Candidatus Lernaella stagnicola]
MARILSGMRPTGKLHLGHLHGALHNWISLTSEYECFYFAADWHALTSEYEDTSTIAPHTRDMVIDWLAAGLDPEKCTIFVQSQVKAHTELALIFGMITPLPWLLKNPSFKDQQENILEKDLNTFGFLGYPVLQAADILIYRAHGVPVGEDQSAHVELSRAIGKRFNHIFGEVFPLPKEILTPTPRVPGTDGRKMSKSYGNAVLLSDPPDLVSQKIRTMVTDPARQRRTDPGDPDICPVFDLHRVYSDEETKDWVRKGCATAGIGCLDCKKPLIEAINQELAPIQERRAELEADETLVDRILEAGNAKARQEAEATMAEVRKVLQFG